MGDKHVCKEGDLKKYFFCDSGCSGTKKKNHDQDLFSFAIYALGLFTFRISVDNMQALSS